MNMNLPTNVLKVFEVVEEYNEDIFLVGGCVRDVYLNRVPKDYDFTSSAKPKELIEMFNLKGFKTVPTGIDYGTITVLIEGEPFEITTFRADGKYSDGRRPSEVEFSKNINEDLKRRDFTMNALAFNPKIGVIDNHNGIEDLNNGIIKAVGNAEERLSEDFLRAFRAIRFANQLEMKIEKTIKVAIEEHSELVRNVSKERVNEELTKTLVSGNNLRYVRLLSVLLKDVLPEFYESFKTPQNHPYHIYSVGQHTVKVVDSIENNIVLKLTALLHDMGKSGCRFTDEEGVDHFYGHNKASEEIAIRFLKELKYSNEIINKVKVLVYYHDRQIEPTMKSVKRVLNKLGADTFLELLKMKQADIMGQNLDHIDRIKNIDRLKEIYLEILDENQCFNLKDLALNGRDLIELGMEKGKKIGIILDILLEKVMDQPELNNKDSLIEITQEIIKKGDK